MQTNLDPSIEQRPHSEDIESILRSCVHCGFCNATCPTYQLLGDERDGPRGRIYLLKQFFETGEAGKATLQHLDRCLGCRSCETTCPSGVKYGELLDQGRAMIQAQTARGPVQSLGRALLLQLLPYPKRFAALLKIGQGFRPLMPSALKRKIPKRQTPPRRSFDPRPKTRRMLALAGCAQSAATPNTNRCAQSVFATLGIDLIEAPAAGCCGAVAYHLGHIDDGLDFMRANIDAWWPEIEAGAEAIVSTASGCGSMIQHYGYALRDDAQYAEKAKTISSLCRDIASVLLDEDLAPLDGAIDTQQKVAVHCPCTLQHAMKAGPDVNRLLEQLGFSLCQTRDNHLCCGSAGSYSILQPKIATALAKNKIKALSPQNPELIVSSNVGCQLHLQASSQSPVKHWIELLQPSD